MLSLFYKRALQDILDNRFQNAVAIITIALSILIVSAFALLFVNLNDLMNSWKKGIRIMAYLKPGASQADRLNLKHRIKGQPGVKVARFISKEDALNQMKLQLKRQSSLLENLAQNPLPDAFEIRMDASYQSREQIESLAMQLESLEEIEEVEYGQRWLERFINIFELFKLTGYAMGGLFFMAALFIVANTIRLVLYARREEIEIMRLVGAADGFIKAPFYIEGLIQGALGGAIGLTSLYIAFHFISSNIEAGFFLDAIHIRFLSPAVSCGIILCSMFVGWLGSLLSLKQFLKIQ